MMINLHDKIWMRVYTREHIEFLLQTFKKLTNSKFKISSIKKSTFSSTHFFLIH